MSIKDLDISKLLVGIGSIIIGVGTLLIGFSIYLFVTKEKISVYGKCIKLSKGYAIVISNNGNKDIYGVKVINTYNNKEVCTLSDIPISGDQYCKVNYPGIYLVKTIQPFTQKVIICK